MLERVIYVYIATLHTLTIPYMRCQKGHVEIRQIPIFHCTAHHLGAGNFRFACILCTTYCTLQEQNCSESGNNPPGSSQSGNNPRGSCLGLRKFEMVTADKVQLGWDHIIRMYKNKNQMLALGVRLVCHTPPRQASSCTVPSGKISYRRAFTIATATQSRLRFCILYSWGGGKGGGDPPITTSAFCFYTFLYGLVEINLLTIGRGGCREKLFQSFVEMSSSIAFHVQIAYPIYFYCRIGFVQANRQIGSNCVVLFQFEE